MIKQEKILVTHDLSNYNAPSFYYEAKYRDHAEDRMLNAPNNFLLKYDFELNKGVNKATISTAITYPERKKNIFFHKAKLEGGLVNFLDVMLDNLDRLHDEI